MKRETQEMNSLVRRAYSLLSSADVEIGGRRVVAGCSGGVDSTILLALLIELGARPTVVHVNYALRGNESELDEACVVELCDRFAVDLDVYRVPTGAMGPFPDKSLQEIARDIRYDRFELVAADRDAAIIAVGHTLDDQAETAFLQILRGTGVEGLGGMPVARVAGTTGSLEVVRPLLSTTREEVVAAARSMGLSWRDDQSNTSEAYARGRFRTTVAPAIDAAFGTDRWLNFGRTANIVGEYLKSDYSHSIDELFQVASDANDRCLRIDVLESLPRVWRRRLILEALRRWCPAVAQTTNQLVSIEDLLTSQVGKLVRSRDTIVARDRDVLAFSLIDGNEGASAEATLECGGSVFIGSRQVHWFELDQHRRPHANLGQDVAHIDAGRLSPHLKVRRWRPGDRMRPLGMEGAKLVSDLLTDRKVAAHRRRDVPVVLSGPDIVWCVGVEISSDYRIQTDTERTAVLIATNLVS